MLNYRYNSRLPTVVTTRLSFDEILGEVDPAISSRLVDSQTSVPFNIMAPDYRGDRKPARKRTSPRGKTGRYR
jgi:DNA replication protein DnaC